MSSRTEGKHNSPFGHDAFGRFAEKLARFFGTPQYIVGQTIVVLIWIALNVTAVVQHWDPYPFILLNLAFSTQAAYAAPLILLAATRQADRDKAKAEADYKHREEIAAIHSIMLKQNTRITKDVHDMVKMINESTVDSRRGKCCKAGGQDCACSRRETELPPES